MSDATFSHETQAFIHRLDQAAQAHLAWTQRVLRCAVLKEAPADDVMAIDAHERCHFGRWFSQQRARFDAIDAPTAQHLAEQHQIMHSAVRNLCASVLAGQAGDPGVLETFEQSQTNTVADLARLKTTCLAHSARIDALTGLPLRYGLEEEFNKHRAQAVRRGEHVVAVMLDIDHFKRVNDLYGHAIGDLALQHVARLLRQLCRVEEPLFRLGGEEFLALLSTTDRTTAGRACDRLLQGLRDAPLQLPGGDLLALRISAGLAAVDKAHPLVDALAQADRGLYAAKAQGRDTWRWGDEAVIRPA